MPLCISSGANVLIYGRQFQGQIVGIQRSLQFLQPFVFRLVKEGCLIFHKFGAPRHVSDVIEACSSFQGPLNSPSNILLLTSAQAAMPFHVGSLDETGFSVPQSLNKPSACQPLSCRTCFFSPVDTDLVNNVDATHSPLSHRSDPFPRCGCFCVPSLYQSWWNQQDTFGVDQKQ